MRGFSLFAIGLFLSSGLVTSTSAQQSSPAQNRPDQAQVKFEHSIVRLIPGEYKNGQWLAGVEIVLSPGWKTYWRVPGDAGVPAEFIWQGSENVAGTDVSWPAPKRYEDVTGKSIGYKKHVVFPVKVKASNPGQPAKLKLKLYYAICSDICVPAQADLKLDLPTQMSGASALETIKEFVAKVPVASEAGIKVSDVKTVVSAGKPVLSVTVAGKNVLDSTDILVEGFEDAYFDQPALVEKQPGQSIFRLPIDGIKKTSELSGKKLTLTVLSGENRLVKTIELE
jgi:DsbC/DsbD-like thiol-disulfide interchange protein